MCLLMMQMAKLGGSSGRQNWLLRTLRHVDGEFLLVVLPMRDVDNERRFLDSTPCIYSSSVTHAHLHQGSAETHRKMNEVNVRWMA